MIGNSLLLDTSVIIDLWRSDDKVIDFLEKQQTLFIPVAVLGELYVGAYRSSNEAKHLSDIKDLLAQSIVLNADAQTAEFYASVKASLLKKGKPIPENDIWIAATALQHQLPLYTNDRHFNEVDNITLMSTSSI